MMTQIPFSPKVFPSLNLAPLGALVLGYFLIAAGGCSVKRRPSIPWNAAILVRPTNPPRSATPADLNEDPVPDLQPEVPSFPLRLISTRNPSRPHVPAPAAGGGADPEKLDAPIIAPQLSPQETVAAQLQTNESLSVAEKNLAGRRGKNLNAAQTDLVSKIQGFIKDAREAARSKDWIRARSLSKKAQLLSEELSGSN